MAFVVDDYQKRLVSTVTVERGVQRQRQLPFALRPLRLALTREVKRL